MISNCGIIRDLLPLYVEGMAGEDTKAFIEGHIAGCLRCRAELQRMKKPVHVPAVVDITPLRSLRKKLLLKRLRTIAFTAALVLVLTSSAFAYLTAPAYIPYSQSLLSVTEKEDGVLILAFSDLVTGCRSFERKDAETGIPTYHIEAWSTPWDQRFSKRGEQSIAITTKPGEPFAVYYSQNNSEEDVLIYGAAPNPDAGMTALPRLALGYYFSLAVLGAVILGAALTVFQKKESVKFWLERILLLPVSYMIAHLCVKGLTMTTYSLQRDFFVIILAAAFVYFALLLGMKLAKSRKTGKEREQS